MKNLSVFGTPSRFDIRPVAGAPKIFERDSWEDSREIIKCCKDKSYKLSTSQQ